ncbi:MAG: hypothetical protein P8047_17895, partial [Gammaproteobacteria bacterium]
MWKYRWFGIAASWLVCIGIWSFVYLNTVLKPILQGLAVDSKQDDTVSLMTRQLMSRPVLEKIIRETDLGLGATNEVQTENLIHHLRNNIVISSPKSDRRDGGNSILTISYTDTKPKLAYEVVKAVINTLVENVLGANQSDTDVAHKFLRGQIDLYEKRLSDAEQKLADFKKKNINVMPEQGGGYYNRLQSANDTLRKIESNLQVARNKVKILKLQIQQEVASSVTASFDKKIQEHKDKLNSLLLQFTDKHPDVVAEKSIIASLKKEKAQAIKDAAANPDYAQNDNSLQLDQVYQNLQISLKEAEINVSNIEESRTQQKQLIQKLQKQVDTVPEIEAQLSRLTRNYEITKAKYAELVSRLDSARISSQADKSSQDINFKVIEPPIVPVLPVGPKRLLLNSAAILAGLAAFFGVTFLILQLKPVFLTSKELTGLTGMPVLGTVTLVQNEKTRKRKRKERFVM